MITKHKRWLFKQPVLGLAVLGRMACTSARVAFKRTNKDGAVKALAIYNYQPTGQTITVDLTNTGISTDQTPIDLVAGTPEPKILHPATVSSCRRVATCFWVFINPKH